MRKAIGDSGERQGSIRTVARKGFRFVAEVTEVAEVAAASPNATASPTPPALQQEVRFCTTADGVRIAWSELGHGPPIVKVGNFLGHLELDLESPVFRPYMTALSQENRLIRYDTRGNGLSDWNVEDISIDGFVRDLEAVVDAAGVDRFALFGLSQGCAFAVTYAVRHPGRVSHLVLLSGYMRGRRQRASARDAAESEAVVALMRQDWGQENPAFRQIFTAQLIPEATAAQTMWLNDMQRIATSPENIVRFRQTVDGIDLSDLLPRLTTPALVLNCRNDANQPFDEGRHLAAGIPGARFVALDGGNHVVLEGDLGWNRLWNEVHAFLRSDPAGREKKKGGS